MEEDPFEIHNQNYLNAFIRGSEGASRAVTGIIVAGLGGLSHNELIEVPAYTVGSLMIVNGSYKVLTGIYKQFQTAKVIRQNQQI